MKISGLLCAGLCLVAGCATKPPPVTTHYDQYTGLRTDLMENLLEAPGQPREVVWLNASRLFQSENQANYYLEVTYMAQKEAGHLEIPPGPTLTLLVDGQRMTMNGSGSFNRRKTYRKEFVTEKALYPVSRHQLQRIASAREVKVQIKGNNGLVEREFGPENFERFRAFVKRAAL